MSLNGDPLKTYLENPKAHDVLVLKWNGYEYNLSKMPEKESKTRHSKKS